MATVTLFGPPSSSASGPPAWLTRQIRTTGSIYYVSATGSDANAGTRRELPKLTLGSANTACTASNGDVIVLLNNYAESFAATVSVKRGVRIVGEGTGSAVATLTEASGTGCFTCVAGDVTIENVKVIAGTGIGGTLTGPGNRMISSQFTVGNGGIGLYVIDTVSVPTCNVVESCTFTSTHASASNGCVVQLTGATDCHGVRVKDCVFDGSSFGWAGASFRMMDTGAGTLLNFEVENPTFRNLSDATLATGYRGRFSEAAGTAYQNGCSIDWTY